MFSASYFTYDNKFSGEYGLQIADFSTESVQEVLSFNPTVLSFKPRLGKSFLFQGISYDEMPQYELCVLSESPLYDEQRREILSWLVGRNGFKKLVIHQHDTEEYSYNCIFSNVRSICVAGVCHGFRLTANFDSPYQSGKEQIYTLNGDGSSVEFVFKNKSDILDDYTYPMVRLRLKHYGSVELINLTDDSSRTFVLSGVDDGCQVVVDNEKRRIESENGENMLNKFNGRWLRLLSGDNKIAAKVNGTIDIICPTYVMIGM